MSEEDFRQQINLRTIKRADPSITAILETSVYSVMYYWDTVKGWEKMKQEGPLFIVKRDTCPAYQLFMLNRVTVKNATIPLIPGEMKFTPRYEEEMLEVAQRGESLRKRIWFSEGPKLVEKFLHATFEIVGEPSKRLDGAGPSPRVQSPAVQPLAAHSPAVPPPTVRPPAAQSPAIRSPATPQSTSQTPTLSELFSGLGPVNPRAYYAPGMMNYDLQPSSQVPLGNQQSYEKAPAQVASPPAPAPAQVPVPARAPIPMEPTHQTPQAVPENKPETAHDLLASILGGGIPLVPPSIRSTPPIPSPHQTRQTPTYHYPVYQDPTHARHPPF